MTWKRSIRVSSDYQMPLSKREWQALMAMDNDGVAIEACVSDWVEPRSVEYNGHFGMYIYFKVDADNIKYVARIEELLRARLKLPPDPIA